MDQKPSVGRIVHYAPLGSVGPIAAIVVADWGSGFVSLVAFDARGAMQQQPSVRYDESGEPGTWRWPPRV